MSSIDQSSSSKALINVTCHRLTGNELRVGPLLEFGLEFRTWELNGVLLSVADPVAGTSLALEMLNGDVSVQIISV